VEVLSKIEPDEAYDWIIVIVRKNQVASVLPDLAANLRTPNILFLVNNAAGSQEMVQALGKERVVLGFPGAGGTRQGYVVCYSLAGNAQPTTLGELDGSLTPRLHQVAGALRQAGFPVAYSRNMDAWLKTHVALVSPIANALYLAGGDNYRLANTRDGIVLMVRAVKEGLRVLDALGVPVTPGRYRLLKWLPEPLLVSLLQRSLPTERAELVLARHANAARDEMKQLADEFRAIARLTLLPTPAIDRLYTYIDPEKPAVPEGSASIPLDWRSAQAAMIVLAGLGAGLIWLRLGRRHK
jgi:2-dehydropantoate 2-reductase